MALIGEPSLLRNPGEGLMGLAQQAFGALYPVLDDVALRPHPGGLLEGAAEVIGAQTGDVGEHREREIIIKMRLDVIAHAPQPLRGKALGGRRGKMPDKMLSDADV